MSTPGSSTKATSIIEDTFADKDIPQKSSLKSVRGNPKQKDVILASQDPVTGAAQFEDQRDMNVSKPVEVMDKKEAPKNILTAWKCIHCNYLNEFGAIANGQCGNDK
jgi:hypothetical protein